MKETVSVYSSYHQIHIRDTKASFGDDDAEFEEDWQYKLWGDSLSLATEDYGYIEVTFQNFEPSGDFIYRGTVDFPTPSGKVVLGDTGSSGLEDITFQVEGSTMELRVFNNRDHCASKIVLVTSTPFELVERSDEPVYETELPADCPENDYFGTKFILDTWEGRDIPTAIDYPCEITVIAGDSEIIRLTGGQNIDDTEIFYAHVYSEDTGVRMHFLDANSPLLKTFIEEEELILLEERVFDCPTNVFTVSDLLGHQSYFTREVFNQQCNVSIYGNTDYEDEDGSLHTLLFVVEG